MFRGGPSIGYDLGIKYIFTAVLLLMSIQFFPYVNYYYRAKLVKLGGVGAGTSVE